MGAGAKAKTVTPVPLFAKKAGNNLP